MEIQRESIFVSTLRSFCRIFFGVCALLLGLIAMSLLYSTVSDTTIEENTTIKYLPDAEGKRDTSSTSPVILQLNIHGVIGDPTNFDSNDIQNILVDSRVGTLKDNRVKGVLIHLNTPGGTVVDSDNIYRMVKAYKERYKVPVFAYVDGLCASGGMYVACSADRVFAGHSSIIGSVGVIIGPFFNFIDGLNRLGIISQTITKGLDKDMMSPFRPWKPGEDASLQAVTAYFYQQFVDIVTTNRPGVDKAKLISEYGAQIFDPTKAQEYGYVDQANATRDEVLLALLKEANVDATKTYQVVRLEPKTQWLTHLIHSKSPLFTGKIEHSINTGAPNIRDQIAYLYQP